MGGILPGSPWGKHHGILDVNWDAKYLNLLFRHLLIKLRCIVLEVSFVD